MQPPQEPYNPQSNDPQPYAQQPYGQPPYGQPPYGQGQYMPQAAYGAPLPIEPRGKVSLDAISEAWGLMKPNLGPLILAVVAYFGIPYAIGMVRSIIQLVGQNSGSSVWLVFSFLIQIITWGVQQILLAGVAKVSVQTVRNRVANINDMWAIKDMWGVVLLSSILQSLIYLVGSIPGLAVMGTSVLVPLYQRGLLNSAVWTGTKPPTIPPSLISGMFSGLAGGLALFVLFSIPFVSLLFLAYPILVDRKTGPWECIARSFGALRKNFGMALLLTIVLGLINLGGFLACCIGILFTFPLTQVVYAVVYKDLFGLEGGSNQTGTVYAPPPIANPNF